MSSRLIERVWLRMCSDRRGRVLVSIVEELKFSTRFPELVLWSKVCGVACVIDICQRVQW